MEMEATFTRAPITEGATRVPEQVSGQVFTPNLPGSHKRVLLLLNEQDRADFDNLPGGPSDAIVTVQDLLTEDFFEVRRADCGAGCFCGGEIVR